MFDAIPYFCALEGDATDESLKKDCFTVLYVLASSQQKESTLGYLVDILADIKVTGSWHARTFLLRFLQIMVFTNLPLLKVGRWKAGVVICRKDFEGWKRAEAPFSRSNYFLFHSIPRCCRTTLRS